MVEILQRLGFSVTVGQDSWQVTTATYRFDMAIEEDLIEEVARIYGYNNILIRACCRCVKHVRS